MMLKLSDREFATVKAALAVYGTELSESGANNMQFYFIDMATANNTVRMLDDEEVSALLNRLESEALCKTM